MGKSIATLLVAVFTASFSLVASAQSKPPRKAADISGIDYCKETKNHVVTLKSILKNQSGSWSTTKRASFERDLVASEKESAICCSDQTKCKKDFEAPAIKKPGK
jgi:hypothetical protein